MRIWILCFLLWPFVVLAEPLTRAEMARFVTTPMTLGENFGNGVWELKDQYDKPAGYALETEYLAPLPGFSGAVINVFLAMDLDGRFLDARLITHNEPIFVSGLGERPFHAFFEQYAGLTLADTIVVGTPYGSGSEGSSLRYLDGVTKATASVRIAHESLLAAAFAVAREKMQGIASGPPLQPVLDSEGTLSWERLVAEGHVSRLVVNNGQVQAAFDGTKWDDDDPEALASPDAPYIDLWLIDIGPRAVARGVLAPGTLEELEDFMQVSTFDEPLLVIETARHGLVSDTFIRNTAPDWLAATQDSLPIALRDADLYVELNDALPDALRDGTAMVLRTDRRLGLDPTRDWELAVTTLRHHGVFQPEVGTRQFTLTHAAPAAYFWQDIPPEPRPAWLEALIARQVDLAVIGTFLLGLTALLFFGQSRVAGLAAFTPLRLGILAFVVGYIGWWAQAQLSIVTVLGTLRATVEGGSFGFLVYDPVSLLVWAAAIIGFVLWGRGYFCGWLCPFGALQEFAHHLGRLLRLPQWMPSEPWDTRLKALKYGVLAGLIIVTFAAPGATEKAAEVEPFKTAITTFFIREWYYVAYALGLLLGAMVLYKGFCRYLCPLGAFMAIGGVLRGRDWIERREACGSPCQLCKVKCNYGAIAKSGEIQYSECFQCLDCVTIHDDETQCVPLILAAKKAARAG
ncbi:4Fe-4S binding protein [Primorskyibacter sp. S187A]|uniref:4Fe-4S binding protein n=1 Tax=Primorskyibacter sp. S187A TaxID=3415130 RepID=UPI003C7C09B4